MCLRLVSATKQSFLMKMLASLLDFYMQGAGSRVDDKGYKSRYVKMVGSGLVFIGLGMVLIRFGYLFVQSCKSRKKPTNCIRDKEKRKSRNKERQTRLK